MADITSKSQTQQNANTQNDVVVQLISRLEKHQRRAFIFLSLLIIGAIFILLIAVVSNIQDSANITFLIVILILISIIAQSIRAFRISSVLSRLHSVRS